ncbi:MAG: glycosyltransferase family 2 protein [Pseudomonadota bacterium]
MKNNTKILTIGIPVYNGERYVANAISSLLNQTFEDFDLIISDNASTDRTESICRDFMQQDGRVKYHRQEYNRGAYWNFNYLFNQSDSKYFKWAAADDVCGERYLQNCIDALESDPAITCCHSRTASIDAAGVELPDVPDPTDGDKIQLPGQRRYDASSDIVHLRFHDVLLVTGWGVRLWGVFPRRYLGKTGLMRPFYGAEKLMMAELASQGHFHDVPDVQFFHRVHSEATSSIGSVKAQNRFSNPNRKRWQFPLLRKLFGYFIVPLKYQNRISDKAMCYFWILRYLFQVNKWLPVIQNSLTGRGIRTAR